MSDHSSYSILIRDHRIDCLATANRLEKVTRWWLSLKGDDYDYHVRDKSGPVVLCKIVVVYLTAEFSG